MIFSAYRTEQFADVEGFGAQLALVFAQYPIDVVEYLVDVRHTCALQNIHKWPPTIAEVRNALEEEKLKREKIAANTWVKPPRYIPPERPNHPGCRCNVFVHAEAPQYEALREWSQSPDADVRDYMDDPHGRPGIWVALNIFNGLDAYRRKSDFKTMSDAELRAHYGQREAEHAAQSR